MRTQTCSEHQKLTLRILLIDIQTQDGSDTTGGVQYCLAVFFVKQNPESGMT